MPSSSRAYDRITDDQLKEHLGRRGWMQCQSKEKGPRYSPGELNPGENIRVQDVKANKVRVGTVRCRRLMVNENETLEAVADEVDDDIDPIPKVERRYKNLFITDPNASYAGKDSWRALKITNNYYQHKKKSSIHTLWAKSAQLLFRVKFISRNRPLINWGGCGRLALYAIPCIYYVVPIW